MPHQEGHIIKLIWSPPPFKYFYPHPSTIIDGWIVSNHGKVILTLISENPLGTPLSVKAHKNIGNFLLIYPLHWLLDLRLYSNTYPNDFWTRYHYIFKKKVNVWYHIRITPENNTRVWLLFNSNSSSDMDFCDWYTAECMYSRKIPPPLCNWILLFHLLLHQ